MNTPPTKVSGPATLSPCCTAPTSTPMAMPNTAGSTPRRMSTTHQLMARKRSAFGSTPKNFHSLRSRRRRNTRRVPLRELLIVGGRPVNRRDGLIVEPQIDGQLAPMMREMVERIAQHDMTRLFHD